MKKCFALINLEKGEFITPSSSSELISYTSPYIDQARLWETEEDSLNWLYKVNTVGLTYFSPVPVYIKL